MATTPHNRIRRRTWREAALLAAFLLVATNAWAGKIALQYGRHVPAKVDYLVQVVAPKAHCLAVSDNLGMLAIGHKTGQPASLTLLRLDDKGHPTGSPLAIQTPCPESLQTRGPQVISLAFHPRLPLLYVWQDVEALPIKKGQPLPPDPAWDDFDHLLIYAVNGDEPELLLSMASGSGFFTGTTAGTLAVDLQSNRLFVPNLRMLNPKVKVTKTCSGIGWYQLGEDGLPILAANQSNQPTSETDKRVPARPKRLAALRDALAAGKAIGGFTASPPSYCFPAPTSGAGIFPVSRDVLLVGGPFGPVTWDQSNRRSPMNLMVLPSNFISNYASRVSKHPTLPVIYVSAIAYRDLYCVEHVDGYLTLAPQVAHMPVGVARSAPVVLAKRSLVGVAGPGAIYLSPIDAEGKFTSEEGLQIPLTGKIVEVLGYSEKFDRLYVAVKKF